MDFIEMSYCRSQSYDSFLQNGYLPAQEMDKKGATPLMWASGGGHLSIVRYLTEECGCDPNQTQRGKRSFSGRTPLHWAARNGHLDVVKYLVQKCQIDIEAATVDGTTSFCWASWQGHIPIMEFLSDHGSEVHSINQFGCNAVLWSAQGKGDTAIMEWLQTKGCEMTKINNNGHGVLHKAAQRGQQAMYSWFFETWIKASVDGKTALKLVGPDTEGYCPSDLAGMEGHHELARSLATMEMDLIKNLSMEYADLPSWLTDAQEGISMRVSEKELYTWERFGGQRRMRSRLVPASESKR
jgi:ankyrin repeat protein